MPRLTKILNITYLVVVLLFLSDVLTGFDIRNQVIKSFVYYGFMIGAPVVFVWNLVAIKEGKKRAMGLVFPIVTLGFTLFIGPVRILFHTGVWRTQTILYQNSHRNFNTVEFQMQDIGGLGYNKRTVEV